LSRDGRNAPRRALLRRLSLKSRGAISPTIPGQSLAHYGRPMHRGCAVPGNQRLVSKHFAMSPPSTHSGRACNQLRTLRSARLAALAAVRARKGNVR
jgi:hypothetical protein